MLALIALLVVWACTAWQSTDSDVVDIACGTRHIYSLLRDLVGAASSSVDDEHPVCPSELIHGPRVPACTSELLPCSAFRDMKREHVGGIVSVFSPRL